MASTAMDGVQLDNVLVARDLLAEQVRPLRPVLPCLFSYEYPLSIATEAHRQAIVLCTYGTGKRCWSCALETLHRSRQRWLGTAWRVRH